ncbi:hypothetical protein B9T29_08690 [Acinetobacter sp. ANC 3903]|uniref:hypothetical protein n=1 Tax=Acinetobacter sp. ANC 3903 TaxID=1977883 RepID=UPI000A32F504|nr:hypothetical protein [Acinetobacter sp. ANC 3903]OTG62098.1 hypothetical protein B9T29_08690 [Acinetobacter sp. ANC 3903]
MAHLKIDEAIKTIKAKTGQTLTYREIARLCEMRELQVCFKWWAGNCHLSIISNDERFDLVSEVKLIGMRGAKFSEELYLTPSYHHEDAVFRAIANNSKDLVGVQIARGLYGKQRELLLMQDVSDHYLCEIESEYRNGWQLFKSPKRFFEFEREDGAFASYTITVDDLLITDNSLSVYIAKSTAKSAVLVEVIDEHSDPASHTLRIATQIMGIIPSEHHAAVTKAGLAKAILDNLRGMGYSKKIKNDKGVAEVESKIIRSVGRWIDKAKPSGGWGMRDVSGEIGAPTKDEQKQSRTLINDAVAVLFGCDNRQNYLFSNSDFGRIFKIKACS